MNTVEGLPGGGETHCLLVCFYKLAGIIAQAGLEVTLHNYVGLGLEMILFPLPLSYW